jgi:hypothetical protein
MGRADATANYCSQCGSRLDRDAKYCGRCGTRCREVTPTDERSRDDVAASDSAGAATRNTNEDLLAFRRRVQGRIADGWDVEHDNGDSVVLVDREFGTLWMHVLLFLFTAGVGNLVYAWHRYVHDADRVLLRAGGTDFEAGRNAYGVSGSDVGTDGVAQEDRSGWATSAGSMASSLAGILLILISVAILVNNPLGPVALLLGLLSFAGAAWVFPPTKERLENRHPVTTFGHTRSVEEEIVADPDVPCVSCASSADGGIRRTYREEYAVVGIPLLTTETGTNVYCRNCASGGVSDVGVTPMAVSEDTDDPSGRHDAAGNRAVETERN